MSELISIILSVTAVIAALISWVRSDFKEALHDAKCDNKVFQLEVARWREEMKQETKDFHGRLCAIEERRLEK